MKIALIGLGDIAQKAYLPLLQEWPEVDWLLCSRNPEVLKRLTRQYGVAEACMDYRQLPAVDAVMIHSATSSHFDIARYFLARKVAVFVDKPLCDNYADCESLHELAAKQGTSLFVGFNRRYLPIVQQEAGSPLTELQNLQSLRWEKHRHNLPGDTRTFVFDDFIHALDGVNLYGNVNPDDIQLQSQFQGLQLSRLRCQWRVGERDFEASMDRRFGMTCERIQLCQDNHTLEFDSFTSGRTLSNNRALQFNLADWTPMLHSKGFYAMLAHWLSVVEQGKLDDASIARNLNSHLLCEEICRRLGA
ncbi:Gfo/Idh/MocA family protein [Bowmanella yangjiangensis]|uniref:Gfo/Idh/MocA family oxidoreductase n=1 Tax=Bowmanella yangjiangensis TaxID=2811230 RepID=A0ABS3CS63_9ALTE|nr:Gfo/Idh/MocA family oxidoreductase [Bowmanella yangjiangensis]MBN7819890.1 Gfo/Idh/MocA family oxidoreductase [Bowmanella yangjiangensis]